VVVLVTIFVGFPEVMIAVVYDIVVFVLEAAANCAAARFSAEKNVKKLNLFQVEVFGL